MPIKTFEIMHGAVLVKICRNGHPVPLTLVENDGSRTYCVNDAHIHIKHSTSPQTRMRTGEKVWTFGFEPKNIQELADCNDSKGGVYLALVCAHENLKDGMEIAFLKPDEVNQCLNLTMLTQQNLSVSIDSDKRLHVRGRGQEFIIKKTALENWDVPNR